MATIVIGGRTYRGNSVSITNGVVVIDGVRQDDSVSGVVEIRVIEGLLGSLSSDASVVCGEVRGDVNVGGSVTCRGVGGSVTAGGSVNCGDVQGSARAGGSIKRS